MPKKSVRDMTKLERMRHSLSNRVFRAVLFGSVSLGVICLLIGLGLYATACCFASKTFSDTSSRIEQQNYKKPQTPNLLRSAALFFLHFILYRINIASPKLKNLYFSFTAI